MRQNQVVMQRPCPLWCVRVCVHSLLLVFLSLATFKILSRSLVLCPLYNLTHPFCLICFVQKHIHEMTNEMNDYNINIKVSNQLLQYL